MPGVIAAGGLETAQAGATILKQGGNAVDAAVAATFVSFVAEVGVVHLGGSGLAHIFDPQKGASYVVDFFSNVPGLAGTPPPQMDFAQVMIDFGATTQSFHLGRASVAVPGNIIGLCQMAAAYGRLPLTQLLQPAISLAQSGIHIAPFQAETCQLLWTIFTHTPTMRAVFASNGHIIQPHEHLHIPYLAQTLQTLAQEGESFARNGRLAQAILHDQQEKGGLLTPTDLETYQVYTVDSIRLPYRQFEVLLPPPSSTGGVLTAFTLKLLAMFDVAALGHNSSAHLQLLYEIMVATNRARPFWEEAIEKEAATIAIQKFLADGFIHPYFLEIQAAIAQQRPSPFVPEPLAPNNTSHLSVIDEDGLAVSLTTTAGESAGYIVPGTGYTPNNMMGEADLHPNGFHTRPAGQRIPTMMTPTIVLLDGKTRLVLGSGGSIRIRSAILQLLSNLLDFKMSLQEAVNHARVHVESGALQCEWGFDETAVSKLEQMGYNVNRWTKRSIYFGGAHAVSRTIDGRLIAAGDNRRGGATATG